MRRAIESGEHLLGLVNDVLDYARLGAGRVELARATASPEELLRSVCELLSPLAHDIEIGWPPTPASRRSWPTRDACGRYR